MAQNKRMALDLTQGSIPKLVVRYSLPFVAANLLQVVYNLVDTIVVGQFVGSAGLSGVSMGGQIVQMFTALTMGLVTAAQVMVSQYVGAKKPEEVNITIGNMATYGGLVALILAVIGILTSRWGLNLINTPAEAMSQAMSYENIMFCGLVFNCGYMTCSSVLRGMGDSKRPFIFIAIASCVNVVLDLLFVGVFHLEAAGAAIATVISHITSFVFALRYIYRHRVNFGLTFKLEYFKLRKDKVWSITRLGIPMALQWIIVSLSTLFVQSLVNSYGLVASAAVAVGTKISTMVNIISLAMSNAVTTITGQNIAARKLNRVREGVRVAVGITIAWMLICMLALEVFPAQFVRIFNNEPEVVAQAAVYLRIVSIGFAFHAIYAVFNGVILGVGNTVLNMFNSLLEGVILKVSLALIFGTLLGLGLNGVFIGNAVAPVGAALSACIYYFSGAWKRRKLIASREGAEVEDD